MEAEIIVVGGGMAGAVAALKASSHGRDVLLIRKGHGSTAMSSGTIDVAGPDGFLPFDAWDALPTPEEKLKNILRAEPLHPYSIIAGGRQGMAQLVPLLRDACDFAIQKISSLRLEGSYERNMALPTVLGTVKFCAFAPASLVAGNLMEMQNAGVLLVGLQGFPHFSPGTCKRALHGYCSQRRPETIAKMDSVEIEIPLGNSAMKMAPFEVASLFDDADVRRQFTLSLSKQVGSSITHIGMPPILGLTKHSEAFDDISSELEPKVFEIVSPTYSVPGHRLQTALDKALRDGGVRVLTADVENVECDGRRIKNLVLGGMKSKRTATARNFVVATGKFSGGGLVSDDFPREPLFRLPLFVDGERADNRFVQYLLDWNAGEKQPFLSCGVHIDSSLRPLDAYGEPAYENLYAAGSVIGEYDYIADRCGLGVAALTGFLAGENVAT